METDAIPESTIKGFCRKFLTAECLTGDCHTCPQKPGALALIVPIGNKECQARRVSRLSATRPWNCNYCGQCGDAR